MKKRTASFAIGFVSLATVAITFTQPTVIHQLVVWAGGIFGLLSVMAVFAISNWPHITAATENSGDTAKIDLVKYLRTRGMPDSAIAANTGIDIDVIEAIR